MKKTVLRGAAVVAAIGCMIWIGLVSAPQGSAPRNQPQATLTTTDLIQGIERIKTEQAKVALPPGKNLSPASKSEAPAPGAALSPEALKRARVEIGPWFRPDLNADTLKALDQIAAIYAEKKAQEEAVQAIVKKKWNPARAQYDNAKSPAEKAAAEARLQSAQREKDLAGGDINKNDHALAASLDLARKAGLLSPTGLSLANWYYTEYLREVKYRGR